MVTVKNTNQDTANADGDSAAAEQFVLNDGDGAQADVKADVKAQNPANAQGTAAGDAQAGFDDITNAATAKDPRIVTAKASDGNQNARTVKPAAPAANFELSDGADQGAGMSVSAGAAPANAASLAQGLGRNVQATANAEQMALLKAQAGMAAEPTQGGTASRSANGSAAVELPGLNGAQNLERFAAAKGKGTTQTIAKNDQEKMVEQVKEMLRRAAQNRDGNSISIRLNPAELGAMVVKVAERHGQIFARVTPENKEVESALRARVHEVTQALVQVGFRADQLHISIGRERTDAETLSFKDFQQHMPQFSGEKGDSQSGKEGNNPELPLASRGSAPQTNVDAGWVA